MCAIQAAHANLAAARPDLRRARVEIFAASTKLVGWFSVTDPERCSLEIRDVVTNKAIVFPAPLTDPDTEPPSDDPMVRSEPKIPAPTAIQRAEIVELVRQLALVDDQLDAVFRHCTTIPDYILATARPDLRRARVEIFAASGKLVDWFAVTDSERCSLEIRETVTNKPMVFPPPLPGPGTKPPSDDPMLRSQPKIPAPTATQLAEIAELVGRLALTDGQVAAVLRRLKVRGGIEAIPDYGTASRVLGALEGVRRIHAKDGRVDPLYDDAVECVVACGRGSVCEVQRRLGIGYGRASRLIESMTAAGILGPGCGNRSRKVMIGREER
ncbi:MAG: DNA translocase FtsK [Planctomycetota bacterium]